MCLHSKSGRSAVGKEKLAAEWRIRVDIGRRREALLRGALGLDRVEHLVVSRFPIATDSLRISEFSRTS